MNILIVRVSSLGDVVHNMPMVADIRRHFPTANIDWVVEESYADLVRLNGDVRNVIPVALRRWRKQLLHPQCRAEIRRFREILRSDAYDVVFDTQGLFKTGLLMRCSRLAPGGQRIGMANSTDGSGYEGISRIFHTHSVAVDRRAHAVARARAVAAVALNYEVDSVADFGLDAPALQPAWLPTQPYAVFFHATARAAKQWAPQNWVQIAQTLASKNLPILLPWGAQHELDAAQALAAQIPQAQVLPRLPLMEAVTLAQRATLAIGVDTGLTHIAAAFCRPTIELYCDSPRWKTEGNWSDHIINLGDEGQSPSIEQVEAAIKTLSDAGFLSSSFSPAKSCDESNHHV